MKTTQKTGEPRINCNASLFGTVRTQILNGITYWKTKIINVGKKIMAKSFMEAHFAKICHSRKIAI